MGRFMPAGMLILILLWLTAMADGQQANLVQTNPTDQIHPNVQPIRIVQPNTVDTPIPPRVTVPGPPVPPDVPNRPLTADEAVQIALRRQPSLTVSRDSLLAAQGRSQTARSALLPSVSGTIGYSHIEILSSQFASSSAGSSGLASGEGFSYTATGRQLIFDFNHTRDLVRQTSFLERVAAHDLTRVESDLVLSVKQSYYTLVQNIQLVTVFEADVANRQNQLALARARLNTGIGLPADVATADTAVAQAVIALNLARNNADLARVNLALILAIDPRTPIRVSDTDEPLFAFNDVNALVETALKQRPEILEAQANIQANHYAVNAAKTITAPAIVGSASLGSRGTGFLTDNSTLVVGAAISFTPFDSGYSAGLVRTARANENAAVAQLVSTQLTVRSDVAQAYLSLRNAEQRIGIADLEIKNASEEVRIAEGRYRTGIGLFQDIITAEAALVTARNDRVTAQYSVNQARAAIRHAIGSR